MMPLGVYPRKIKECIYMDDVIKIPLSQGKWATIDKDNYHLTAYNWNCTNHGYPVKGWRLCGKGENRKLRKMFLHHAIMGFPINGMQIDHIDRDKLNCTRSNLRIVSPRINVHNRLFRKDGEFSSKYIGVARTKSGKWSARIKVNDVVENLGVFIKEKDAARAYQKRFLEVEP